MADSRFEFIRLHTPEYSISELCRLLSVSPQGYRKHHKSKTKPPKDAALLAALQGILLEDEYNDTYGRQRLHDSLLLQGFTVSLSTVYRVCKKHGLLAKKHGPKGLTKAEKATYKNDDLLKGNFAADAPNQKLISDITQLPAKDGTLYISGIFDCYDNQCVGLSMSDNMRTELVIESLSMAGKNEDIKGAMFHTDRGSQYTSYEFRSITKKFEVVQSMSFAGSSCYGNAKCESMWARMKEEAIYGRNKTVQMSMEAVKSLVFRYYMGYWNHRRICHAIGGMAPARKRSLFYQSQKSAA